MFGNLFNNQKKADNNQDTSVPQQASTTSEVKTEETVNGGGFGVAGVIGGSDILGNPVSVVAPVFGAPVVSQTSKTTEKKTTSNSQGSQNQGQNPTQDEKNITASPSARENITALSRLDPRSTKVLAQAQTLAKNHNQSTVEPVHILYGLLYDSEVSKTLESFSVNIAKLSKEIEGNQKNGEFNGQPTLGEESKKIFEESYTTATSRGSSFISPEDILLALFNTQDASEVLKEKGIELEKVESTLARSGTYTVAKKSMIEKYSIDLTLEAQEGRLDPVTGRDKEVERLIHILLRRTKNNPIIIGEAGVGKTAIVEGLAQKIVEGKIPKDLVGRKIMQLDLASLIAGASHRGEFEERFRVVIKEAQASTGQLILFIDEIHSLIGAGDEGGAMDASNIIKPYLARGQIQLIGTTTTAEFRKYFEKDKAFERRFQPVKVDEPDEETAIEMLKVLQPKYEKFHRVIYAPEAIEAAVHLSKKYIGERFLPDKAVDLLDEAGAEVKLESDEGKRQLTNTLNLSESRDDSSQNDNDKARDADKKQADMQKIEGQKGGVANQNDNNIQQVENNTISNGQEQQDESSTQQGVSQVDPYAAKNDSQQGPSSGRNSKVASPSPQEGQQASTEVSKDGQDVRQNESLRDEKVSAISDPAHDNIVRKSDIEKVVSSWTGIPITKLTEDESQKLIKLEELIHKRFIDQEEAVVTIAESIRRGRIGLSAANRPIASFIFLGPTGVGKTELAKAIAEILFGKEESMVRLDMSEYMEKHEVAKLIGAPPGYVGYEEGGQLTEAVRTKPYSIVLLDEVEKAHPDVFNILLQLLEDGRLTDNKGNTISFKNTVIVATSNLGSSIIQKELAEGGANLKKEEFDKKFANLSKILMDELHKFFRPELLNRFDGLVVFKPLSPKDMEQISKLTIEKTKKLLKEQGYDLQITQNALDKLAKDGYDPVYGARPLRRLIQTSIENPISLLIISQEFVVGDSILIDFDAQKGEYKFTKATQEKKNQAEGSETEANKGGSDGTQQPQQTANPEQAVQGAQSSEDGLQQQDGQPASNNVEGSESNGQENFAQPQNNISEQQDGSVPQTSQQKPQVINEEPVYGDNNNGMSPIVPGETNIQENPQPQDNTGSSGTQMQKSQ